MVANWVTNYCDVCIIYFAGEFKSWGISQGDSKIELCVMCIVESRALQTPLHVVLTLRPNQLVSKIPFVCSASCRAGTGA